MDTISPPISDLSWGNVVVQETEGEKTYKDAKLWPGGSRGWDWNETGTEHSPGIQPEDVQELVENGAERVILSQGQYNRLDVMDKTLEWLEDQNVEVEVLTTSEAVDRYNELSTSENVGALIHSTC